MPNTYTLRIGALSDYELAAAGASFGVTGQAATLTYDGPILNALGGSVAVTGAAATLTDSGGASWPDNEPAGMTLVLSTDGSDKFFGFDGSLSGTADDGGTRSGAGWFMGNRWNDPTQTPANVADANSKYGTVIQQNFYNGDPEGWLGLWEYQWPSTYRHAYRRMVLLYSSNYQVCSTDEKPGAYMGGPAHASGYYLRMNTSRQWFAHNQFPNAGSPSDIDLFTLTFNQYVTVEEYLVAESSAGASDGEYYYWVDGTLVASGTGYNWTSGTPGWDYIYGPMYWGGGGCTKTGGDYIRYSEVYISGKN